MEAALTPISKSKLITPEQVPYYLLQRRIQVWRDQLPAIPFPRASYRVPAKIKSAVVEEIFVKHWAELSPFFHKSIRLIGGIAGEPAEESVLEQLANLKLFAWGAKDGGTKDADTYLKELREKNGATPIFVYFGEGERVEGAVFPVQARNRHVTTWDGAVLNDSVHGDVLACPMICSNGAVKGLGGALIVNGVLPYATVLAYFRFIYDLIAYSRPADYGPEKRTVPILEHLPTDPNWDKFHRKNHAHLVCVVENGINALDEKAGGYGFIAGYTKHLLPNSNFLAALVKIGDEIKKTFNLVDRVRKTLNKNLKEMQ